MRLSYLAPCVCLGLQAAQVQGLRVGDIEDQLLAKVYGVAVKGRSASGQVPTPTGFPEWVAGNAKTYTYKAVDDWTSGFFGGTLWQLYEMSKLTQLRVSTAELLYLARTWTAPLYSQKDRTDTHDLGFMIHNSWGFEAILNNNATAKAVVHDAAIALSQRFNPVTKTIRSWGSISDTGSYQVIIDNMMNLEMLYWAAKEFGNTTLSDIATTHAISTMNNHFRPDGGSYHVLNYNQQTGAVIAKYTNQGYMDWSTWSRGQAWAAYGFVSAYKWTKNPAFLAKAKNATDYFLSRLPEDGVPHWDFDAPRPCPRDTSASMIMASGMLFLIEEDPDSEAKYLDAAIKMIDDTLALSQSDAATYTTNGQYNVTNIGFESILMNGTIDNNPAHTHSIRSADTGIVYQGYYLAEAWNRLIKMGVL